MNILFLTYEVADEGGNFIRCFSLAKNFVRFGHRVTILAGNKKASFFEKKYQRQGVTILEIACPLPHRLRHNGTSPFQIFNRILHVLRHRYDLVHGFGQRPAVVIPALVHKFYYRRPYLADWADLWGWGGLASYRGGVWGNLAGLADDLAERIVYRLADAVTVIAGYLKEKALAYGVDPKKIFQVPVGANVDTIVPLPQREMRLKHNLSLGASIVVFVGNAKYDADLLAKSFLELLKLRPKAKLMFIGREMPNFNQIIKTAKAQSAIIYKGFVPNDELPELLACGDVMLLPYTDRAINRGRFPNKIGDYLAAGRPTVANPTGDLKRLFEKDEVGILAPESPKKFASAIAHLLKNKALRQKLGQNARRVAETKYAWRLIAKNLETIYESALFS